MKSFVTNMLRKMSGAFMSEGSFPELESFKDLLALEVDWSPLKRGGASFSTHKSRMLSPSILEFKSTIGNKLFSLLFFLIGLVLFALGIYQIANLADWNFALVVLLITGIVFAIAGVFLLRSAALRIVFDKEQGFFWKGRFGPYEVPNKESIKTINRLDDIHSVQVISERVSGSKRSYESYEINLVLKDLKRINIVDHADYAQIIVDSSLLAEFLDVPLWVYLNKVVENQYE